VDGNVRGTADPHSTVQIKTGMQQVQQSKNALQFLLNGFFQRSGERIDASS